MRVNVDHVDLEIEETQGKSPEEFAIELRQAYYMKQYLTDDSGVSLGKFAELMGMGYEEARDWLNAHGVTAPKKLSPEAKAWSRKSREAALKGMGLQ